MAPDTAPKPRAAAAAGRETPTVRARGVRHAVYLARAALDNSSGVPNSLTTNADLCRRTFLQAVAMPARRTSAGGGAASGWERQLEAYVRAQGGTPGAQRTARMRLADAVRVAPQSPEAWWALLAAEEAGGGGSTATLDRTGAPARGGISLFDLYGAATRAVPRQGNYGNECFVRIWLGFARQQWCAGCWVQLISSGKACLHLLCMLHHAWLWHLPICCPLAQPL